ncbi:MAG: aminoacyl-tRNA hydrolase [Planctomycetaceae bacterium]|nr:aminoacyl-tRNA hydrolase [Planctomycetaceae bacterium]
MKVVVGLGNPGRDYENTRHNVGFAVVNELARRGGAARPTAKFQAELTEIRFGSEKVALVSPLTYMNRSGSTIGPLVAFYKLPLENLIVVCDDLSLPLGKIRVRGQGSSGGQKGLLDVIRVLGCESFPRLRIGIGATPTGWETADYVLARFSNEELIVMQQAVANAADAVESWVTAGLLATMNKYN